MLTPICPLLVPSRAFGPVIRWEEDRPDGRILECRYDPHLEVKMDHSVDAPSHITTQGGWRFLRFRNDKITPNEKSVVSKILKSIQDNVTREEVRNVLCSLEDVKWFSGEFLASRTVRVHQGQLETERDQHPGFQCTINKTGPRNDLSTKDGIYTLEEET